MADGFEEVPIQALSTGSRGLLSQSLNPKQVLMSYKGRPRDYRGIAELAGLAYDRVQNYQNLADPMAVLLSDIDKMPIGDKAIRKTFRDLIDWLEEIERFDVADDMMESLKQDASTFRSHAKALESNTVLDSSINASNVRETNSTALTIQDIITSGPTFYHAFICYADQDRPFVEKVVQFLEREGVRLLLRDRDLLLGSSEQDAIMKLIETRCRRMIVVLTPEFLRSTHCEFQTRFALSLAIEQRSRILIPVIYKKCELPTVIKCLTKIDLSDENQSSAWAWNKLLASVKGDISSGSSNSSFIPITKNSVTQLAITAQAAEAFGGPTTKFGEKNSDKGSIKKSFDNSNGNNASMPPLPTAPPASQTNSIDRNISELLAQLPPPAYSDLEPRSSTGSPKNGSKATADPTKAMDSDSKKKTKSGWMQSIKKKITRNSAYAQLNS